MVGLHEILGLNTRNCIIIQIIVFHVFWEKYMKQRGGKKNKRRFRTGTKGRLRMHNVKTLESIILWRKMSNSHRGFHDINTSGSIWEKICKFAHTAARNYFLSEDIFHWTLCIFLNQEFLYHTRVAIVLHLQLSVCTIAHVHCLGKRVLRKWRSNKGHLQATILRGTLHTPALTSWDQKTGRCYACFTWWISNREHITTISAESRMVGVRILRTSFTCAHQPFSYLWCGVVASGWCAFAHQPLCVFVHMVAVTRTLGIWTSVRWKRQSSGNEFSYHNHHTSTSHFQIARCRTSFPGTGI